MKFLLVIAGSVVFVAASAAIHSQATNTFPTTGNVGIGTTSPSTPLQINEQTATNGTDIYVGQPISSFSPNNTIPLYFGKADFATLNEGANVEGAVIGVSEDNGPWDSLGAQFVSSGTNPTGTAKGFIIGTATSATLDSTGSAVNAMASYFIAGNNSTGTVATAVGVEIDSGLNSGGGTLTNNYGLLIYDQNTGQNNYAIKTGLGTVSFGDHVGIGTTSPGAALEVNGNIKMTYNQSSPTSLTFSDGSIQTTAYTGVICGGDYAESMDVTGDRTKYAPGDVLVLDPDNPGKVLKSIDAYSTTVAGIYSTKPGTVGRRQLTPKSETEVPMAMMGVVPTKVTAENGPIRIGDLLVSSSRPGYAMKGTDRSKMLGSVVGKAMAPLASGTGIIEVLVTLQ